MSEVQLIGDSQITMDFFLPLDNNLKTKTMLGFFYLNFSFSSFIIDRALQHVLQLNCYDLTLPSVFYSVCSIYCI